MTGTSIRTIARGRRTALLLGAIGLIATITSFFFSRPIVMQAYWMAWLFWAGIGFGALTVLMMGNLTGGTWIRAIREPAEAAARTLPFMGLLVIPVLFGLGEIFPWMHRDLFAGHDWPHKSAYLTAPWFAIRSLTYMLVISACTVELGLWGDNVRLPRHVRQPHTSTGTASAGGLVVYGLVMLFASTDWVLSLEPQWYSTMFFVILAASQFLSALALMTMLTASTNEAEFPLTPKQLNDLGNLLLAFVIFWAYVTFSQFLIIWSGNLPREISWYLHRSSGHWPRVVVALAVFQFGIPFALLLSRAAKRRRQILRWIAFLIFAANALHIWWLTAPSFQRTPLSFPIEIVLFVTVGAIWTLIFLSLLSRPIPSTAVA